MTNNKTVVHVIVNNLGGITSLIRNLINYSGNDALPQELILLDIKNNKSTPAFLKEDKNHFYIDPHDNWYYTYSRLAKQLSKSEGVLISNDQYDLIMLRAFNIPRKVIQLVHDKYNLELALKFEDVVDHFVSHSYFFYQEINNLLPHRKQDIHYIPYGIPMMPITEEKNSTGSSLNLLFLGRHDMAKGIYDLHKINNLLKEKSINVNWLILGKGPETDKVKEQWQEENNVKFYTPSTTDEVLHLAGKQDILVFPTQFEGFPVALIEAMSMGCVPVVTDLPGGIRELINKNVGFLCNVGNIHDFETAIQKLHEDRTLLATMQKEAAHLVRSKHDAKIQSPLYQELFKKISNSSGIPRHQSIHKKIGSKLDHLYIPNFITKNIRKIK